MIITRILDIQIPPEVFLVFFACLGWVGPNIFSGGVTGWSAGEILKLPEIPVMKKARTCEKALSQTNRQTLGKIQPTN